MVSKSITPGRKLYSGMREEKIMEERSVYARSPNHGEAIEGVNAVEAKDRQIQQLQRQLEDQADALRDLRDQIAHLQKELADSETALLASRSINSEFENTLLEEKLKARAQAEEEARGVLASEHEVIVAEYRRRGTQALEGLYHSYSHILHEAENTMADIAFSSAIKLLGEVHAANNPQYRKYLADTVHELTMNLSTWDHLRIRFNPDDYEIIFGHASDGTLAVAAEHVMGIPRSCFVKDDAVSVGDCKVNSVHGELEVRLSQRIASLKTAFISSTRSRSR